MGDCHQAVQPRSRRRGGEREIGRRCIGEIATGAEKVFIHSLCKLMESVLTQDMVCRGCNISTQRPFTSHDA